MKSLQQKLMESLIEDVPAQIEQPKQLAAGDDVLVDWDGEQVTGIVVSVVDGIVKVNRVIDGETVDRDYTLSQLQSLEEPIEVEAVTDITESAALTALVQQWDDMYGENFAKEYPEAFKKMKAKNSKTLTDIEAVWLDIYGERFKDEYQGIYTALSKTLNEDGDEVDENVNEAKIEDVAAKVDAVHGYKNGRYIVFAAKTQANIETVKKNLTKHYNIDAKSMYDDGNVNAKLPFEVHVLSSAFNMTLNESLESEQFINRIKALDAKFELYHHNTGSFAKHKTFDDIYTEFDQLEDDLIEKIMGYTGEKYTGVNIDLVYSDNTGQELVNDLMNLGSGLQEFAKANGYSDIEQYGQTIHGLGAKLNYLLTFNENVSEAVVNDKESFKEYAETVMKQAHGDNYDQAIVDKMVDDIASEVGDDWGAAVGQLTSGLGEDLKPLPNATSNADGVAMRTESKDLAPKEYEALSDKDKKRYVYNKETDTWMFDSIVSEAVDKEDEEPKSKEYEAGLAAGEEGTLNEEDCPYEAGTDEAKDWSEGYKAGCKQ